MFLTKLKKIIPSINGKTSQKTTTAPTRYVRFENISVRKLLQRVIKVMIEQYFDVSLQRPFLLLHAAQSKKTIHKNDFQPKIDRKISRNIQPGPGKQYSLVFKKKSVVNNCKNRKFSTFNFISGYSSF